MGAAGASSDGISGTLWTVGRGEDGSTGNEAVASTSSFAQIKTGISNWSGLCHGPPQRPWVGVTADGKRYAWGKGNPGSGGWGDVANRSSPVQIGSLTNWGTVVGVSDYKVSQHIKTDGTLWASGQGSDGKTGLNNTTDYSSPVQVGSLTNWAHVSMGVSQAAGGKPDGTRWQWGAGAGGVRLSVTRIVGPAQRK